LTDPLARRFLAFDQLDELGRHAHDFGGVDTRQPWAAARRCRLRSESYPDGAVPDSHPSPTYQAIGSDYWMAAADLEKLARRHLNPALFDFVSGGAGDELTMAANLAAFRRWRLRPRVLSKMTAVSLTTKLFGSSLEIPVFVAPMGRQWALHSEGEAGTAAGAAAAGAGFVLSSDSPRTLASVAAAGGPALWYQLYFRSDRPTTSSLIAAAEAAGYRAICVTVDTPVLGLRRRDVRHSFSTGRGAPLGDQPAPKVAPAHEFHPGVSAFAPTTWDDIDWLRAQTRLPIVMKGILDPADAVLAIEHGLDGVIVSNHGGRQLDHAVASLDALPGVVEAVAGRIPVLFDSGVRRGTDIAIALCLGARAVGLGRPALWALAVDGRTGVERLLRALAADLARTLVLLGAESVGQLGPQHVQREPAGQ
jgi:4-hydroxymandelate oxidase